MKELTFLFVVVLSFLGCNPKNEKNIEGNWYSCSRNGDYIEFFLKDSKYKYSSNFGMVTKWEEYKAIGDTLIQYNTVLIEDSIVIHKAIVKYLADNQIELNYLTSNEVWLLNRIDEEINLDETDNKILEGTLRRFDLIGCMDERSDKEKQQDSLDMLIKFQF